MLFPFNRTNCLSLPISLMPSIKKLKRILKFKALNLSNYFPNQTCRPSSPVRPTSTNRQDAIWDKSHATMSATAYRWTSLITIRHAAQSVTVMIDSITLITITITAADTGDRTSDKQANGMEPGWQISTSIKRLCRIRDEKMLALKCLSLIDLFTTLLTHCLKLEKSIHFSTI